MSRLGRSPSVSALEPVVVPTVSVSSPPLQSFPHKRLPTLANISAPGLQQPPTTPATPTVIATPVPITPTCQQCKLKLVDTAIVHKRTREVHFVYCGDCAKM